MADLARQLEKLFEARFKNEDPALIKRVLAETMFLFGVATANLRIKGTLDVPDHYMDGFNDMS